VHLHGNDITPSWNPDSALAEGLQALTK